MPADELIEYLQTAYDGLVLINTYGEKSLFYNPNKILPNGVYFATIKQDDGQNDKASNLSREGVYRLNFGITKESYENLFGPKPARPSKGGVVATGHDFTVINKLTPHPIYAWLHWVAILNPSKDKLNQIKPLIDENYQKVLKAYKANIAKHKAVRNSL